MSNELQRGILRLCMSVVIVWFASAVLDLYGAVQVPKWILLVGSILMVAQFFVGFLPQAQDGGHIVSGAVAAWGALHLQHIIYPPALVPDSVLFVCACLIILLLLYGFLLSFVRPKEFFR